MADAFRGLTLRLGADARPLQSAISSITQSAAQAQRQMNKLNKALEFDSTNVKLMQSRLDLVGDKALHSARAMSKIQTAMRQASSETLKFSERSGLGSQKVRDLANNMTKVYSATQKARSEQTHVAAELQHIYDAAKKVAHVDMGITWKKADKYVKGLQRNLSMGGAAADRAEAKLTDLFNKIKADSGVFEKFGLMAGDVKGLEERFHALRGAYKEVSSDLKNLNKVEGFRNAAMDVKVFESEVRQAAAQAAKFNTEMHKLGTRGNLASSISQMKRFDSATEKAVEHAKAMSSAYKALPNSASALAHKISAVAAAEKTLKANINAISSAMDKIRHDPAFDKMAESSEEAYIKAEKVEQAYEDIYASLSKATAKAEAWKNKLNSAIDSGKVKNGSNSIKLYEAAIEAAKQKVTELKAKLASMDDAHSTAALTLEMKELKNAAAKATAQMAALKASTSKLNAVANVGKAFRNFGFGMYASMTPAAMMAGRYMIQAAEDTDSAYRDMRKTVNGTEEEFEHLKDAAIEFSRSHVTTAQDILEIESIGGQLGVQVQDLEAFARTVSNLDIATNMEAEDIATDLGKMATVMGLNVEEYDKFGDALVRLGNNMPALESDIMTITTRMMGMAEAVGMTPDQMLAWSTAATATGQKPYAAGSSLSRFMKYLNSAVAENGEALEKWAAIAGQSTDEFATAFKEDASGAMYSVIEGLGDIQKSGGDVSGTLIDLGINGVQDTQLLLGLANQMAHANDETNILADSIRLANDAFNGMPSNYHGRVEAAADAMREAEKKSEGFSGQMGKLRNQAKAMLIELSEGAAPIVGRLSDMFRKLSSVFSNMSPGMKTFTVGAMGVAAALGPLTVGLGTFLQLGRGVGTVFGAISSGLTKVGFGVQLIGKEGGKLQKFGGIIEKLGSTTGGNLAFMGIAAGIGLVAYAIADYVKKEQQFKKATDGIANSAVKLTHLGDGAKGIDEYGKAVENTTKSFDKLVENQARIAESQSQRADTAQEDIGKLMAAQQVIDQYANTDLSGNISAQGQLRAAIEMVNDVCGTQYSVIDAVNGKLADENGKIMENVAALDEYIQKKIDAVKADALIESLAEQQVQQDDLIAKMVQAQQELSELESERGGIPGANDEKNELAILNKKDEIAQLQQLIDANDAAIQGMTNELGAMEEASSSLNASIDTLALGNSTINAIFGGNQAELNAFAATLREAGMTTEEFYSVTQEQWGAAAIAFRQSGGDMKATMDALGLTIRSLAEQYEAEVMSATGATDDWAASVEHTGMNADELAATMQQGGMSAQQFAAIGSSAFNALWTSANGDMTQIMNTIALVNAAGLDPKQITVNSDGLLVVGDQIITLNDELAQVGDQEYTVNASGDFEPVKAEMAETEAEAEEGAEYEVDAEFEGDDELYEYEDELNEIPEEVSTSLDVNVDTEELQSVLGEMLSSGDMAVNATVNFTSSGYEDTSSQWSSLKSSVEAGAQGKLTFDTSSMEQAIIVSGNLKTAIGNIPSAKGVYIPITGGALDTINSINWALNNMTTYKEITIKTIRKTEEAGKKAGAIVPGFARGGMIPRHADGAINGIVRSAMLTNIGWVGEAGAEAVMHMRNAGGAVVPLTNRRYVRPFARAVAYEAADMGGYSGRGGDTYNTTINTTGSGDELARTLTGALNTYSRLHSRRR